MALLRAHWQQGVEQVVEKLQEAVIIVNNPSKFYTRHGNTTNLIAQYRHFNGRGVSLSWLANDLAEKIGFKKDDAERNFLYMVVTEQLQEQLVEIKDFLSRLETRDAAMNVVVSRDLATGYLITSSGDPIVLTEQIRSFINSPFKGFSDIMDGLNINKIEDMFQSNYVRGGRFLAPQFNFLDIKSSTSMAQQVVDAIPKHFEQMQQGIDWDDMGWSAALRIILKETGVVDQMNNIKQKQLNGLGLVRLKTVGDKELLTALSRINLGPMEHAEINDKTFGEIFPKGNRDREMMDGQIKQWLSQENVRQSWGTIGTIIFGRICPAVEIECQKPERIFHSFAIQTYEDKPSGLARIQRLLNALIQPTGAGSLWLMHHIDPQLTEFSFGVENDPQGIAAKTFIIELLHRWGVDAAMKAGKNKAIEGYFSRIKNGDEKVFEELKGSYGEEELAVAIEVLRKCLLELDGKQYGRMIYLASEALDRIRESRGRT